MQHRDSLSSTDASSTRCSADNTAARSSDRAQPVSGTSPMSVTQTLDGGGTMSDATSQARQQSVAVTAAGNKSSSPGIEHHTAGTANAPAVIRSSSGDQQCSRFVAVHCCLRPPSFTGFYF